jgi:HK97 family phage major capsid protein
MITASVTPHSNGGVTFEHIRSGTSSVDQLWENNGGFSTFAEYCLTAVRSQPAIQGGNARSESPKYQRWREAATLYRRWIDQQDTRTVNRAVSTPDGMYESSEPDGGSLIPPGFVKNVFDKARARDTPLARCRTIVVERHAGTWPAIAETSRVDGSRWGGLLSYWEGEGQQLVNSLPTLFNNQYRCKKLTALVPVTDELFEDASLLEPFLDEVVPKEFAFQTNEAMINGSGAGRLLGVVNSPATISVAKDVSQTAGTVTVGNVAKLWTQSHGPSRANMVFYAQEDADPDTLAASTVSAVTSWTAPQASAAVKGRPWLPLENCQPLGTPGDVVLGDWSQYALLYHGMRKSISMHFHFDRGEHMLRYVWRCDGQCLWQSPLTPPHSTIPKSPFLIIQQR